MSCYSQRPLVSNSSDTSDTTIRSDSGGHRLFVTKLAADMSRSDILDYFSAFGPVADLYFPVKDPAAESAKPHKGKFGKTP